jgi:O-antigen ligase
VIDTGNTPALASAISPRDRSSRFRELTFLALFAYLPCPLFELPGVGVSLSAIAIALLAPHTLRRVWRRPYRVWALIVTMFIAGVLLSWMWNYATSFTPPALITLVRWMFWTVAFLASLYQGSRLQDGMNLLRAISVGILATALLRLYEAVGLGRIGAWSGVTIFSQNDYGLLFSTFFAFPLILMLWGRGTGRALGAIAATAIILAAAVNGSRGAWIGVIISLAAVVMLTLISGKHHRWMGVVTALTIVGINVAAVSTDSLPRFVSDRFSTFSRLENDKSFAIRVLMVQKGLTLFEENPVAGVGVGQFSATSADLELPALLRYGSQASFNSRSAHNAYVAMLAETGLLGCIPFAMMLVLLLTKGARSSLGVRVASQSWRIAAFCSMLGMSAHIYALAGLSSTAPWAVYGLVAGGTIAARASLRPIRRGEISL